VTEFPPVNEHIPPPSLSKGKSDQSRLKSLLGVPQRDKVTPDRTASRWAPAKSLDRAAGNKRKNVNHVGLVRLRGKLLLITEGDGVKLPALGARWRCFSKRSGLSRLLMDENALSPFRGPD
jgi:hypothetical protein